jgi:hypothetical protein
MIYEYIDLANIHITICHNNKFTHLDYGWLISNSMCNNYFSSLALFVIIANSHILIMVG